jgi:CRISPR/Cas system-associated protein Cas5 (RAMP superfamily)
LQLFLNKLDRLVRNTVVIEKVPRNEEKINRLVDCTVDNSFKAAAVESTVRLPLFSNAKTVAIEVNIRRMQNFQRAYT